MQSSGIRGALALIVALIVAFALGPLAGPLAAIAQPTTKPPRIGVLVAKQATQTIPIVMAGSDDPAVGVAYPRWLEEVKVTTRSLRVQLEVVGARGPDDFEKAFATMTRERAGALLVLADGMAILHRTRV